MLFSTALSALCVQDYFDIGMKGISGNNSRSVRFNLSIYDLINLICKLFIKINMHWWMPQLKIKNK